MNPFVHREDGFLYEQIATTVSSMVESGTLQPGDQLPSVRQLSRTQGVSISTVVHAYRLLEDRGLVEAHPKSGFYVRAVERAPITEPSITRPPRYCCEVGIKDLVMRLLTTLSDPDVVRLGAALPADELLPTERLGRHLARVARQSDHQSPAYDPLGYPLLRRVVAQRGLLAGCSFDAADVVITNGCMEALSLSLQAVTEPGDTVAIESPSYFGSLLLLQKLGLRALELPTSPQTGVCLEGVWEALNREDVAAHKMAHTVSTAAPMQQAVAEFLDHGGYERHLRTLRRHYQDNLTRMRHAVAEAFPEGTRVTSPQGGFLLWVELPEDVDTTLLSDRAYERGISVAPGALFSPSDTYRHCLRLNGGQVWSDRVEDALDTLGTLARELCAEPELA